MDVTLSNGTVLVCRGVPPYALGVVYRRVKEPAFPYIMETSVAGGSEKLPALEGTTEYSEYREAMRAYRKELTQMTMQFYINYGVVGWYPPGEDGPMHAHPPVEWEVDEILQMYGEKASDDPATRRYQYITYELIRTDEDSVLVDKAVGMHGGSDGQPVTQEDVDAAMSPFVSEVPEDVQ